MNSTTAANIRKANASRELRAYQQSGEYLILDSMDNEGEFWVSKLHGADDTCYTTTANTCSCKDTEKRPGLTCKHQHLVRFHLEAQAPAPVKPAGPSAEELARAARRAKVNRDREALWG